MVTGIVIVNRGGGYDSERQGQQWRMAMVTKTMIVDSSRDQARKWQPQQREQMVAETITVDSSRDHARKWQLQQRQQMVTETAIVYHGSDCNSKQQ